MTERGPRGQMAASRPPLRLVTNLAAASCRLGQEMARRTRRDGKVGSRSFSGFNSDLNQSFVRRKGSPRTSVRSEAWGGALSDSLCNY